MAPLIKIATDRMRNYLCLSSLAQLSREYDQELPQSKTTDQPTAPPGRDKTDFNHKTRTKHKIPTYPPTHTQENVKIAFGITTSMFRAWTDLFSISSQGHNMYKLNYVSLEEVKIVHFLRFQSETTDSMSEII